MNLMATTTASRMAPDPSEFNPANQNIGGPGVKPADTPPTQPTDPAPSTPTVEPEEIYNDDDLDDDDEDIEGLDEDEDED